MVESELKMLLYFDKSTEKKSWNFFFAYISTIGYFIKVFNVNKTELELLETNLIFEDFIDV